MVMLACCIVLSSPNLGHVRTCHELAGGQQVHWSDIWGGQQSLYLRHVHQVLTFSCSQGSAGKQPAPWTMLWTLAKTVQLPQVLFATSLSPDGKHLAALKGIYSEEGYPKPNICHLIHHNLADQTEHLVVEEFDYGGFYTQWLPGQRLAEHRAYLVPDHWQRVYFCDCYSHCVLQIVDTRPWPMCPRLCGFACSWLSNRFATFTADGRSAFMKAEDVPDIHMISWRSEAREAGPHAHLIGH